MSICCLTPCIVSYLKAWFFMRAITRGGGGGGGGHSLILLYGDVLPSKVYFLESKLYNGVSFLAFSSKTGYPSGLEL